MSSEVEGQCEATTFASTMEKRCTNAARHWSHVIDGGDGEPFPKGRLVLCTQHFTILERYRRRGTASALLSFWHSK